MNYEEKIIQAIRIGLVVANFLLNIGHVLKAIELCKESLVLISNKALSIEKQLGQLISENIYRTMLKAYLSVDDHTNVIACGRKLLAIHRRCGDTVREGFYSVLLARMYNSQSMYADAKQLLERAIPAIRTTGKRSEEAGAYVELGTAFRCLGDYVKAKEYHEKALAIFMEIGDRKGEGRCHGNLGTVFGSLGEYVKAKQYFEKALAISMEIGDRKGEGACYGNLGNVFRFLGGNVNAREYYEKALAISIEIGDRNGKGTNYGRLGNVFHSLGEYVKATEYQETALAISMEIGDKAGEGACYKNLGNVFRSLGEYVKAREYQEKALAISLEIGDRAREGVCYRNLGNVFKSLGEYVKAKEYFEKALVISKEIGDREEEGRNYEALGNVFRALAEYLKAKEYYEKALVISMEIGDRNGEGGNYVQLGNVFSDLGENVNGKEYYKKALDIQIEFGDRQEQLITYYNLSVVCNELGEFRQSKSYCDEALAISMERCDKEGEANCYIREGSFFLSLGDKEKAKAGFKKSLAIAVKAGDRELEARNYLCLGQVYQSLGNHYVAEEYLEKALSISKDIGNAKIEFLCYCKLSLTKLSQENFYGAFSLLFRSIEKSEKIRGFLQGSDQMKISFADEYRYPYQLLSELFCDAGNPKDALNVVELGRARALADLMATQYSAEKRISADPKSSTGVENVMNKEINCTCLYISYSDQRVFLWILKTSGVIQLQKFEVDEKFLHTRLTKVASDLDEFFDIMAESFQSFGILPEVVCEDRSFRDSNMETDTESCQKESPATLRQGKPGNINDPEPSLTLFYKMLVHPVSDLLDEPEIIIVPDRSLYRVPFPALLNERGKYLSENFRIRVVPSLSTLKLIQDSPADYHSQTDALVVGDPDVGGKVIYRGSEKRDFYPLPGARKEAEMIGRRLGVQPLLGEDATKPAVLERIKSASLIHIAAHGNAERGEIALAPPASTTGIPQEDDYLLKMSDIAKVQVRAKLVVLSCCHSGRGQNRAEGVVGIARAFLGSGARSVLVALWALDDITTKKLMSRFYEHLVGGESASVSLHAAMKWMRDHGFTKVPSWAPFMLIGDDVTFAEFADIC